MTKTKAARKPPRKAVLKLSSQEGRIPGDDLAEKVRTLESWGGAGIELGKAGLAERVGEIRRALKGTRVKVSAVCAGYFGLISPVKSTRERGLAELKALLAPAGEIGSTGVIVVPAFNRHRQLAGWKGREVLVEMLGRAGAEAAKRGTRILLEPLNRTEATFLRQLADAASICRDVDSRGVALMGDFYHMFIEETSDRGAFISAGGHCHHVHLASRTRILPSQDDRSFVDGFGGLKVIGYRDYCSLECGVRGQPAKEIPKSFRFLQRQWAAAKP